MTKLRSFLTSKKNILEHVLVFVLVCLWQRVDTKGIIRFQLQYKDDKGRFIGCPSKHTRSSA